MPQRPWAGPRHRDRNSTTYPGRHGHGHTTRPKFRTRISRICGATCSPLAALFIVLGGTAVALPGKNTVDSGDIQNKAVKTKDIAKEAVTEKKIADGAVTSPKLAAGSVGTQKIADNAVTGAKADEASFQGLVKGDGRQSDR